MNRTSVDTGRVPVPAGNGGFTLLELVCALFIITTAGFGALQLYHIGIDKTKVVAEHDIATSILKGEMERLRTVPFADLSRHEAFAAMPPEAAVLHEPEGFLDMEQVMPGLTSVTVTLRWQSRHGRWVTRSLTTRIANKGAPLPEPGAEGGRP